MIKGLLSIELYVAHQRGHSIEDIAKALDIPQNVIAERIESARLCVQHQMPNLTVW